MPRSILGAGATTLNKTTFLLFGPDLWVGRMTRTNGKKKEIKMQYNVKK